MANGDVVEPGSGKGNPVTTPPRPEDVVSSLQTQGILHPYEVQVLATMGLLIGYICVLFAKILNFTNIYIGLLGVSLITFLLMLLNKDVKWNDGRFWVRSFVVIFLCLLLTAPQLYFAWTVSVAEARAALEEQNRRHAESKAAESIQPSTTVTNNH